MAEEEATPKIRDTPVTKERMVPGVPPPAEATLPRSKLFDRKGMPNLPVLKDHLFHEGRLFEEDALKLFMDAKEIFMNESNLLDVEAPAVVCGDLHGQFYDLMKLLDAGGDPASTRYLFLGDYVDRGCFSCEVVFYMFALKITYPKTFFMIRGNHECRHMTDYFNFKDECTVKYSVELYDTLMTVFDCIPLAAVLNKQFLCIHGGLSGDIKTLDDIKTVDRVTEPPSVGPMCDMLWADPVETYDDDDDQTEFTPNTTRGCSYFYGFKAMCRFLDRNGLLCCIRAHEVQDKGYRMYRKHPKTGFPTLITLFSAPNYCDAYNNEAAILKYDTATMNIKQFNCMPHPYWLPNFVDVFTWSLPFVAEKMTDVLYHVLNMAVEDEEQEGMSEARKMAIKAKMRSVSKMLRMFQTLRTERENILQLKQLVPNSKLPFGMLQQGPQAIRDALSNFDKAKQADRVNEMRPPMPGPGYPTPILFILKVSVLHWPHPRHRQYLTRKPVSAFRFIFIMPRFRIWRLFYIVLPEQIRGIYSTQTAIFLSRCLGLPPAVHSNQSHSTPCSHSFSYPLTCFALHESSSHTF